MVTSLQRRIKADAHQYHDIHNVDPEIVFYAVTVHPHGIVAKSEFVIQIRPNHHWTGNGGVIQHVQHAGHDVL